MNKQIPRVVLLIVAFAFLSEARRCHDRIATKSCQYFVKVYREQNIDCCKWKPEIRANCAMTCKLCEPKPRCATSVSRYGCCWDNKTEAKSYNGDGCPECEDAYPSYCSQRVSRFTKEKACNERGRKMCPQSCGVCRVKASAQAIPDCLNSPYGCCWDLTAATGPRGKGCRVCENHYNRLCSLWSNYCQPDAYLFVKKFVVDRYRDTCPMTCGKCKRGQRTLDLKAYKKL